MKTNEQTRRGFIRSAAAVAAFCGCDWAWAADAAPAKTFKDDWDYLKRKWREPCANPATGLECADFTKALAALVKEREPLEDWSFVKARVFALGCDRAAIGISRHDWYPAFASWHYHRAHPFWGPMGERMYKIDEKYNPGLQAQLRKVREIGQFSIWKDFCHCSPDWDRILALGFPGMKEELLKHWKDTVFYQSKRMAADAVLRLLDRLIAETEAEIARDPGPRLPKELACLKRLRKGRPETAYDVMQFIYLFWVMCENFDKYQARTLGNIDRLLTPYYRADLAAGRTTEAEFRDQLAHFWWQWGSINNYWGQPVYIGGTKADGSTEYNEVSKIVLDIHDELALPTPKMHVKIAANTPDWVWTKTLDMVRRNRSITFCGEAPIGRVMKSRGCSDEAIRTFALWGCYEWGVRDFCVSGGSCVHNNLLKNVELTLADAKDGKFPEPKTFDEFKKVLYGRFAASAAEALRLAGLNDGHRVDVNPSNMIALSIARSVNTGIEPLELNPNAGVMLIGLGTTVDALQAINEIVYERKECTLAELGRIMAANWKGHEELRLRMLRSKHKWGNNDPATNALGQELIRVCASHILNKPTGRGGRYGMSGHTARQHIELGRKMGATPDGRLAGEEMSKNISPTMGADTEGVTALVNTVANLDARNLPGDFPLDVAMLPQTVAGEKGLQIMRTIVERYFKNGGMVIQFNIHSPEMLKEAQKHPEKYENLQVRVCGWNVRWNDIPRVEQDKYIRRAERIMQ